jgi:hypothetical protein
VEVVEPARGDVQLQVFLMRVAGQGLDVFPGHQDLRELVFEEPFGQALDRLQEPQAPEDPPPPDVDVDDPQVLVDDQEVDVVDPLDLGAGRIHDLLVQELLLEEHLLALDLKGVESIFRAGLENDVFPHEARDFGPVQGERLLSSQSDDRGAYLRKTLRKPDFEVREFSQAPAVGADDRAAQNLGDVDEPFRPDDRRARRGPGKLLRPVNISRGIHGISRGVRLECL